MGFQHLIDFIRAGEAVSAGVANRPLRSLDDNIRYLLELIQGMIAGQPGFAYSVAIEPDALLGMPVYFNTATQRYERCLALLDSDSGSAFLRTADMSRPWGVIAEKSGSTASLLLFGLAQIDISAALGLPAGSAVPAGTYYLSAITPGRLTTTRPPFAVAVLRADGNGNILVTPQLVDYLDRHQHLKFSLTCLPAGETTPPGDGGSVHVITSPDAAIPGWLPANHESFEGRAPIGAAFGYNLPAHAELAAVWPPSPVSSAHLEIDRGVVASSVGGTGVPAEVCIIDRYGIWWMTNCAGYAPWPTNLTADSESGSTSYSLSLSDEACPPEVPMRLTLWLNKVQFATDETVLTSLASATGALKVYRAGTQTPATAGALDLVLEMGDLVVGEDDEPGYLVHKTLSGFTFKRGPVVSGIYGVGDNVTVTGAAEVPIDPEDEDGAQMQVGPVAIEVAELRELPAQTVNIIANVTDVYYLDTPYLNMPAGVDSSYRVRFDVPADLTLAAPVARLRLRILGRTAGTAPQLVVTGRIVPRPADGLSTPAALPTSGVEFAVVIDTGATLATTDTYVEAISDAIAVEPGDMLFFTVARESADGYAGAVGILLQQVDVAAGD